MRITIILVAPARAENIGAAARAMKTMGFSDLRIVDSQAHLEPATRWVAHGSTWRFSFSSQTCEMFIRY